MHKLILTQYVADAFTDKVFKGNPAAVCILEEWLPDGLMQDIAKENNLSESAFAVKKGRVPAALVHSRRESGLMRPCYFGRRFCSYELLR